MKVSWLLALMPWFIFQFGCRTTELSSAEANGSDLAANAQSQNSLPDSKKCGRDHSEPMCNEGEVCVQPFGGTSEGTCHVDQNVSHRPKNASVLKKLKVEPKNAGINPAFSAIGISAQVMIGSNPCQAKGKKAELISVVKKSDGETVTHIWPVVKGSAPEGRCTREFNPQYKTATAQLLSLKQDSDRVVVHGIEDAGTEQSKLVFGTVCPIPACAQPPPGCSLNMPQPNLLDSRGCAVIKCGIMECTAPNACAEGESLVEIGRNPATGCPRKPVCVGRDTCPMRLPMPPDWCKNGRIVPRGMNERGCTLGAACIKDESSCPQLVRPGPGFCDGGEIVGAGVDENGCTRVPHCVMPGQCQ